MAQSGKAAKKSSSSSYSGSSSLPHHRNDDINSVFTLPVSLNDVDSNRPLESLSTLTPILQDTDDFPRRTSGFTNPLSSRRRGGAKNAGVFRSTGSYTSSGAAASALVAGVGAGGEGGFLASSHDEGIFESSFSLSDGHSGADDDWRLDAEGLMSGSSAGDGGRGGEPGGHRAGNHRRLKSCENPLFKVGVPRPSTGGLGGTGKRFAEMMTTSGEVMPHYKIFLKGRSAGGSYLHRPCVSVQLLTLWVFQN